MKLREYIKKQVRTLLESNNFVNQEEIDAILDKVAATGIESLTSYERMRLDGAGEHDTTPDITVAEWINQNLGEFELQTIEHERYLDREHYFETLEGLNFAVLHERSNGAHQLEFHQGVFKEMELVLGKNYHEICLELTRWVKHFYDLSPITVKVVELD